MNVYFPVLLIYQCFNPVFKVFRFFLWKGSVFQDIDSDEVLSIVYTMHAFYVTKVIGTDPDYLKSVPLVWFVSTLLSCVKRV